MNLVERRRTFQLFGGVTQHFVIRRAVVEPVPFYIDNGNHVSDIFADKLKELFSLEQASASAVELELLVDSVQIKEQYDGYQSPHCTLQGKCRLQLHRTRRRLFER